MKKTGVVNCPVCGKECNGSSGVSSHLYKNKSLDHRKFVDQQNIIIDQAFLADISCETLAASAECWASTCYICGRWQKIPGYKERKSHMNSLHLQYEWANGLRTLPAGLTNAGRPYDLDKNNTISREQYNKIVVFFTSDLGITNIAQQVECNPKTVYSTFVKEFGEQETKARGYKLHSLTGKKSGGNNKIENKNPELVENIIKAFSENESLRSVVVRLDIASSAVTRIWIKRFGLKAYEERCAKELELQHKKATKLIEDIIEAFPGDEGNETVRKRLHVTYSTVKNIWIENFGLEAYEARVAKMLRIQREKAAVTLEKARFTGSKNEILCYDLLKEALPNLEVKQHDYIIVYKLELDIIIPALKLAITWDGVGHRKPVYGEKPFNKVTSNDKRREQALTRLGWRQIAVIDNGSYNPKFVNKMVSQITDLLPREWVGKFEIG